MIMSPKNATILALMVLLTNMVFSSLNAQQTIQFEEILLSEIGQFNPKEKPNQLIVKMEFGRSDWINQDKLLQLDGELVTSIDYYYTDFPKGRSFEKLHSARFTKLAQILPGLWDRKFMISWRAYEQTNCETEEEARSYFHGFVIRYDPANKLDFLSEADQAKLNEIKAEVKLNSPNSTNEVAQFLEGAGVEISNLRINDTVKLTKSYLYFEEEEGVIGITEGLLLTTGIAANAVGPNDTPRKTYRMSSKPVEDPKILSLFPNSKQLYDPCIVEFDIQIDADSLVFNYVFASEEYPEYLDYHDVFGFFIAGKGIGGAKYIKLTPEALEQLKEEQELPDALMAELKKIAQKPFINKKGFLAIMRRKFKNKASSYLKQIDPYIVDIKNLAVVPGTGEQVSVASINHTRNKHLFRSNDLVNSPSLFKAWQYDGFSVPLQASVQITPNEVYHLTLAIADQRDARYDSAVFIEGKGIKAKKKKGL